MRDLVLEIATWVCACAAGVALAIVARKLPWQSWIVIAPTLALGTWRGVYSSRAATPTRLDSLLVIVAVAFALGLTALAICGCT